VTVLKSVRETAEGRWEGFIPSGRGICGRMLRDEEDFDRVD
jgi:hypothetical protein